MFSLPWVNKEKLLAKDRDRIISILAEKEVSNKIKHSSKATLNDQIAKNLLSERKEKTKNWDEFD